MPDQGENIFNNVTPPEGDKQPTPPVDKYADLLKSIKNESGEQKYDSIEKALEALGHSQSFIPQIKSQLTEKEQELERVKAELSQRQSVEEVMRSEEQTSELQSLMRISYDVFRLKTHNSQTTDHNNNISYINNTHTT